MARKRGKKQAQQPAHGWTHARVFWYAWAGCGAVLAVSFLPVVHWASMAGLSFTAAFEAYRLVSTAKANKGKVYYWQVKQPLLLLFALFADAILFSSDARVFLVVVFILFTIVARKVG